MNSLSISVKTRACNSNLLDKMVDRSPRDKSFTESAEGVFFNI